MADNNDKPDLLDAKKLILTRMNTGLTIEEIDMLGTEEAVDELITFFNKEHDKALNPKKRGDKFKFARIQNSRKKDITEKVESGDKEVTKTRFNVEQVWRPNRAWQTDKMKEAKDGNSFIIRRHNIRGRYDSWGELI
jgi:hypothetical protein